MPLRKVRIHFVYSPSYGLNIKLVYIDLSGAQIQEKDSSEFILVTKVTGNHSTIIPEIHDNSLKIEKEKTWRAMKSYVLMGYAIKMCGQKTKEYIGKNLPR